MVAFARLDDTPGIERGLESPSTWKSPWYIDMRKHFQVNSFLLLCIPSLASDYHEFGILYMSLEWSHALQEILIHVMPDKVLPKKNLINWATPCDRFDTELFKVSKFILATFLTLPSSLLNSETNYVPISEYLPFLFHWAYLKPLVLVIAPSLGQQSARGLSSCQLHAYLTISVVRQVWKHLSLLL